MVLRVETSRGWIRTHMWFKAWPLRPIQPAVLITNFSYNKAPLFREKELWVFDDCLPNELMNGEISGLDFKHSVQAISHEFIAFFRLKRFQKLFKHWLGRFQLQNDVGRGRSQTWIFARVWENRQKSRLFFFEQRRRKLLQRFQCGQSELSRSRF